MHKKKITRGSVLLLSILLIIGIGYDVSSFTQIHAKNSYSKYEITIDYVDVTTNEKIIRSVKEIKNVNEKWSYDSPTIDGYELIDSNQKTVMGIAAGDKLNIGVTVKYKKKTANYNVVGLWRDSQGVYHEIANENHSGTIDELITVNPPTIEGFSLITPVNNELRLSGDGLATKSYYYEIDDAFYTIFFYTQGSYVPHITATEGQTVVAPNSPTRVGYIFSGWDTQVPSTMPSTNLFINATWTPDVVNYTIEYYKQDTVNYEQYNFVTRETASGLADSSTPTAPLMDITTGDFKWFEYAKEQSVIIKGDGSSVLRVYYDLVKIKTYYKLEITSSKTIDISESTAPMFSNNHVPFPDDDYTYSLYRAEGGQTRYNLDGWWAPNSIKANHAVQTPTLNEEIVDFDAKEAVFLAKFTALSYRYYLIITSIPNFDGGFDFQYREVRITSTSVKAGFATKEGFVVKKYRTAYATSISKITNYSAWIIGKPAPDATVSLSLPTNCVEVEYERVPYDIVYNSLGEEVGRETYLYEEEFTLSTTTGANLTPPAQGYAFVGWYDNPQFEGEPISKGKTSIGGNNYYAKWEMEKLAVTFDSNGGSEVAKQMVSVGNLALSPKEPTKKGHSFIGWFYKDSSGYYIRAVFDKPIERNVELIAMWDPGIGVVGCTVIHQDEFGNILYEDTSKMGTYPEVITVSQLPIDATERKGLKYVDAQYKSLKLSPETEKNVVTFIYYEDHEPVDYTVEYLELETLNPLAKPKQINGSLSWLLEVFPQEISGYKATSESAVISKDDSIYTFYYEKDNSFRQQPPSTGINDSTALYSSALVFASLGGLLILIKKKYLTRP